MNLRRATDVNAYLTALTAARGRRGGELRISSAAERSPSSDAVEFWLELRIAEQVACAIDGKTLVHTAVVHDLVAQKVDDAAALLRGKLVCQLLAEPVTFDDDPAADQEERLRLAKTLALETA